MYGYKIVTASDNAFHNFLLCLLVQILSEEDKNYMRNCVQFSQVRVGFFLPF